MRQLWDGKGSAEVELMTPPTLAGYAQLCGWTLARAHARTGDRRRSPPTSARATASTARSPSSRFAYADQNDADYAVLIEAQRTGDLRGRHRPLIHR